MRHLKKPLALSPALAALLVGLGIFAGTALLWHLFQPSQTPVKQPTAELVFDAPAAEDTALFTFGDEASQTILLELINAQADEEAKQYTLTTAPANNQLHPAELAGQQLVCAGTRLATVTAENESRTSLDAFKKLGNSWFPLLDDSYEINLWNPSGQYDEYTLASPEGENVIEHCSHFIDEDV